MYSHYRVVEAATEVLRAFQCPNNLPEPLTPDYICRQDQSPCRKWSWQNQLTIALHGYADARSYDQWLEVGRYVKRGEKAFYLSPPEKDLTYGFRGAPVFGLDQTDGQPLPVADRTVDHWLASLPLRGVADLWGLSVQTFNGKGATVLGQYNGSRKSIALGVKNLSTWAHELVHAADDQNGKLHRDRQRWRKETVAELGGAVLLKILGYDYDADLGGCRNYLLDCLRQQKSRQIKVSHKLLDRIVGAVASILEAERAYKAELLREKMEYEWSAAEC